MTKRIEIICAEKTIKEHEFYRLIDKDEKFEENKIRRELVTGLANELINNYENLPIEFLKVNEIRFGEVRFRAEMFLISEDELKILKEKERAYNAFMAENMTRKEND